MRLGGWALVFLLAGCAPRPPAAPTPPATARGAATPLRFASVAERAGIRFTLGNRGKTPLNILETAGGGCAFIDFDGDGWPDVLLAGPGRAALYRNRGNGTFVDVTARSGIVSHRRWMGCATGDYDGDGRPDLFLTGYRCHALYRNIGAGRFMDVTARSGVAGLDWSLSAAFADLDGDGRLDLFVTQYLRFDPPATPDLCQVGNVRSACGPEVYQPLSGKLFLGGSGGRFHPAPWRDTGKTWGVLASDLLDRGRPALYLANDMMPGDLWSFENGGWRNRGPASGTAYDAQGRLQGAMGVDSGDYDNDGRLDLLVTTYASQEVGLYHNDGDGLFTVAGGTAGLGAATLPYVGFGTALADFDNDGWLDLIIANGHVRDNVADFDTAQSYAQPVEVFHNGRGRFTDASAGAISPDSDARIVGRGLALADYNRDGRVDALICNLEGPARLLENQSDTGRRRWLDVRLRSARPNRFGLGARVTLTTGMGDRQVREIRTAGSTMSAHDPVAHFGLGDDPGPATLVVRWPNGATQTLAVAKTDTTVTITEPTNVR